MLPDERGIPDLARDLIRAALGLGRNTARMLGLEAREIARRTGRRVALLVASAVIAGAGIVLVLGALTLVAERFLGLPRWASLALVGMLALGAGAAGIASAVRRLGDPDLAFPETIGEITKDVDALAITRDQR
jgi:hypothetical protein